MCCTSANTQAYASPSVDVSGQDWPGTGGQPSPTDKVPGKECAWVTLNETLIEKTQPGNIKQNMLLFFMEVPLWTENNFLFRA